MTHDELLAKIDYTVAIYEGLSVLDIRVLTAYLKALRAVVELHKPVQSYIFEEEACSHCSSREDRSEILYPCQTIQAIEEELK